MQKNRIFLLIMIPKITIVLMIKKSKTKVVYLMKIYISPSLVLKPTRMYIHNFTVAKPRSMADFTKPMTKRASKPHNPPCWNRRF